MKRVLLTFMAAAATVAATAQDIYKTDFSTEEEFQKWTVIDANGDNATWKFDAEGSQSHVYYPYSETNQADDWLVSPAITPKKTGNLLVKYTTYGTSYGERIEVRTGSKPTVSALKKLQNLNDAVKGQATTESFIYSAKEGEPFYVGFRCFSPADQWKFYMCNFSVTEIDKAIDLQATDLLAPQTGDNLTDAETVKIRVANIGFDASQNFKVAYQIDDREPVVEDVNATLAAGESMEYTFNTKADFSEPRHNYNVKVYSIDADDYNMANDTCQVAVRHNGALTPPCTWGFEPKEDNVQFKYYNLNEDDGNWTLHSDFWMNMARTGVTCLAYNYNKENNANDWAVLDPVKVEAGYYVLRYWYSGSDGHTEKLGVYYGNGNTPADMTNKIDEQTIQQGAYQEAFKVIKFDKPQTIYLGFYAFSDKDENWLTIDDVQFYKASSDASDLGISSISKPFDYARTPNDKNVEFEVQNVGIKDAEGKAIISVDGEVKKEIALDMKAQKITTFTAEDVIAGLPQGKHKLKIEIQSADDSSTDNNVIEKEFVSLVTPAILYDFEDAKIPEDFSFYVGDKGTVNPNAGEEFNEQGWGIFNLGKHEMLGEHLLAGTSWIDGATPDRWIILPQVKVTDENTYFAWDANSFNAYGNLDSYNVKVSDGSTNPADYWYTSEAKISNESTTPKTRGISLGKYNGKNIAVAFNIVSKKGEALCLDNLGFYGGIEKVATGIKDIASDAHEMIAFDSNSFAAAGAASISIVDVSGRTVMNVNGNEASISSLQSGVYAAVVNYGNGKTRTVKFVKK